MSKIKVTTISDPDNDNTALTIDSSGNVTFAGDVDLSAGTVTGISSGIGIIEFNKNIISSKDVGDIILTSIEVSLKVIVSQSNWNFQFITNMDNLRYFPSSHLTP